MPQIYGTALSLSHTLVNLLTPFENHSPSQFLLTHCEQLYGLSDVIAKPMIEGSLNLLMLITISLWKRCHDIQPNDTSPILQNIKDKEKEQITEQIMYTQWQQRQHIPQAIQYIV